MQLRRPSREALLVAGGAAAAAALVGAMAWRALAAPAPPEVLPLPERRARLADAQATFRRMFPEVRQVGAREAARLAEQQPDKFVLVDVRNEDEQQVSMAAAAGGGRALTLAEFDRRREARQLPAGVTAICYCTVGYRSSRKAEELAAAGLPAANMEGGILAWTHEGLPLVEGGGDRATPTTAVHTYAEKWAFHGESYTPVFYKHSLLRMLRDELGAMRRRVFG